MFHCGLGESAGVPKSMIF